MKTRISLPMCENFLEHCRIYPNVRLVFGRDLSEHRQESILNSNYSCNTSHYARVSRGQSVIRIVIPISCCTPRQTRCGFGSDRHLQLYSLWGRSYTHTHVCICVSAGICVCREGERRSYGRGTTAGRIDKARRARKLHLTPQISCSGTF